MTDLVVVAGLAFGLACLALLALRRFARYLPQAVPNDRSLHVRIVPRAGGWAVWAGFVPVALLWPPSYPGGTAGWLPGFVALAGVSALDDARSLPIWIRLSVHAAVAIWTASALLGSWLPDGPLSSLALGRIALIALTALLIAWSLNLYNFMDGSDGLAATMAVIGFAAYAAGTPRNDPGIYACVALVAATLPVLFVNAPPAKIFLGDIGAIPLGFLAVAFGLAGVAQDRWPLWFPALVFLPFWSDATLTLARRALRGERIWEAHNVHYYQRLFRLGAGHRGTLAMYTASMLGSAASAVACLRFAPSLGASILLVWLFVMGALFLAIDYHWRRQTS
jgi:UDP-GlcNAc:undecaprenyl-phosphate/decaprenyl-phosphate GlcNAc-1-phosphate transferase